SARLVRHAREHRALLAVLDFPERVAAELEVVALLVDGEAAVAVDEDAVFDAADQVVERHALLAGLERDVGHALERYARPRVGIAAAARFFFADERRLVADGLVVRENAL